MDSTIRYDSSRPLMRLEKGDQCFITYLGSTSGTSDKDKEKYSSVPKGTFPAIYKGNYVVECEKYPELSGKYNYWRGDRWGTTSLLWAHEKEKRF
ncbi:hypothetical protein [Enterococcus sp. AZ163]|uniref:hypothetical protein n=1 Tax=Enterococcus sp. AZ163 TaxID=2774638 RepID=UPI003D29CB62